MALSKQQNILLIISGGIAAYKSLELIRLLKKDGANVRAILTKGGSQFVTPLSVSALCENECFTDLWSLKDETEMGHIRLSREADLIIIAPASADLLAKIAGGHADDLATTTLLASDKPVTIVPAMNHMMWNNPATQANITKLREYGHTFIGPTEGDMACGEHGMGRMSEPQDIFDHLKKNSKPNPLSGLKALVTSGPTYEPLDPVRFIGNRSSGKQGHAIAAALSKAGANVTLISGPVSIPNPKGVHTIHIETAAEMLEACQNALPTDIAICAAAVADWGAETNAHKIKKREDGALPVLALKENPDILRAIATHKKRPNLVIGFAAETENLAANATAKLAKKNCDLVLANLVQSGAESVFGSDQNHVYLIDANGSQDWGKVDKKAIAARLVAEIEKRVEK
ncbi:MAG: bifunctional phosphopantothenoylcysteine decarboxylase/phosphopantothenate--cysteine ligase CoaBC [Micavibrio sp.]|nr:bifunctional phosphopantothenoylcysteine decarboxylase/phosphopantothenate--cysteine ligase CoaBC [Micavibrio sp.]